MYLIANTNKDVGKGSVFLGYPFGQNGREYSVLRRVSLGGRIHNDRVLRFYADSCKPPLSAAAVRTLRKRIVPARIQSGAVCTVPRIVSSQAAVISACILMISTADCYLFPFNLDWQSIIVHLFSLPRV